jgi:hypothetical protein
MTRWLLRMGLAAGLGAGLMPAGVGAQDVQTTPPVVVHNYCVPQVVVIAQPPDPAPPRPPSKGFLRSFCDCWHRQGYACWTELGHPGCSSISSELTFMFGSCRQFFSEPCYTGPAGGYGNGGGCNCRP